MPKQYTPFQKKCNNILHSDTLTEYYLIYKLTDLTKIASRKAYEKRKQNLQYRKFKLKIDSHYRTRLRESIIEILGGPMCIFCGYNKDVRALHLDHKFSEGKLDKKRFKSNIAMYRHYRNNPDVAKLCLQVLCANCNAIKRHTNREWGNKLIEGTELKHIDPLTALK